jgi:hypothetical protein
MVAGVLGRIPDPTNGAPQQAIVVAGLPSSIPAPPGLIDNALTFLYTLAHWLGERVVDVLHTILPEATHATLATLIDPIGFLAILTVFLFVAEIAKKLAWFVLVLGWALIVVRIMLDTGVG